MAAVVPKVAVLGSGISGAVCASTLARNGLSVTIFDSARGPGGRMSQRREITEDGRELLFDHGAPNFTASDTDMLGLIRDWEARGFVAEWKENFGSFDVVSKQFGNIEKGKGVYQFVDKYGANVDGYSPIYNTDDWSPTGDVYTGGTTGLAIWAVTLLGILAGGALLVYNTSALAQ